MTQETSRRDFLQGAADFAGAAPFATLLAAAPAHAAEPGPQGVAAGQTRKLAEYASALRYEEIPSAVIQRAKDTIADTVATIMYGGELPWSCIAIRSIRARSTNRQCAAPTSWASRQE